MMFRIIFVSMSWQLEAHPTLEATATEEKEDYFQYFVTEQRPAEGCSHTIASDSDGNGQHDNTGLPRFLKAQRCGRGPSDQVQ